MEVLHHSRRAFTNGVLPIKMGLMVAVDESQLQTHAIGIGANGILPIYDGCVSHVESRDIPCECSVEAPERAKEPLNVRSPLETKES